MPKLRELISFFFYLNYAPINHAILDLYIIISLLSFSLAVAILCMRRYNIDTYNRVHLTSTTVSVQQLL